MRILSAKIQNFSSYKDLEFNFEDRGLTLISGPTGSGKSTLCDIIPWVLWGRTAKNGAVDEVLPWVGEGLTYGAIEVMCGHNTNIVVTRTRGVNDLFYAKGDGEPIRGKDLKDTQKLIDDLLGATLEDYVSAAYLHEFSQSAMFFTANSKIRKQITDQLVDLTFTNSVADSASEYKKVIKSNLEELTSQLNRDSQILANIVDSVSNLSEKSTAWEKALGKKVATLENMALDSSMSEQYVKFLSQKTRLEDTIKDLTSQVIPSEELVKTRANIQAKFDTLKDEVCSECGAFKNNSARLLIIKETHKIDRREIDNDNLIARIHQFETQLETHLSNEPSKDPHNYSLMIAQAEAEINPYTELYKDAQSKSVVYKTAIAAHKMETLVMKQELSDTETLLDILSGLRTKIVKNTVSSLECNTNKLLTNYFDGELRVSFTLEEGDKLEVEVTKDGNIATFTQLSKGQRQLLKLCLGLSIAKVASNSNGVSFNVLFVDECTDGLSEDMKSKAFHLLESLIEYDSIFLVDHSEGLKSMANDQIRVRLENSHSVLEEA